MTKAIILLIGVVSIFITNIPQSFASEKEIIERLARLEEGQKAIIQRFEDVNRRFEDMNKRFEDMNRRFEDINRQLDRLTAIFTALVIAVIGFAYWDRRTIIKKAKEETISEIEKEGRLKDAIRALRELANKDKELLKILKENNLL